MRKILCMLLSLALMLALLSGCGSNTNTSTKDSGGTAAASVTSEASDKSDTSDAAPKGEDDASDDDTVYTIRIGCTAALPNQMVWVAYQFESAIEEQSNGRIQVEVYPSSQLGTTTELIEGMQNGSVDAACFPGNWLISYAPLMGYMEVPGLQGVDSVSFCHIGNDVDGMLDFVNAYLEGFSLHLLGYIPTDSTKTMLCNRAISSVADLKAVPVEIAKLGKANDLTLYTLNSRILRLISI